MEYFSLAQSRVASNDSQSLNQENTVSAAYNGMSVKEGEAAVKSEVEVGSLQTPQLNLSERETEGLNSDSLLLGSQDDKSKSFNEVVRRIQPTKQLVIMEKLAKVTSEQISDLMQCCNKPDLITKNYLQFFQSEDFPYVALKVFRDGKIDVYEFSTLASMHGIYKENIENNPNFKITHRTLFDQNGNPNEESWEIIKKTLDVSNKQRLTFVAYNIENTVKKMQDNLKKASCLEAGFWHYDIPKFSEDTTIADIARFIGAYALSRYDNQEIVPSTSLRQAVVDSAFEEAALINPVIGVSTPDDLRLGALGWYRDFALPFPDHFLPKIADSFSAPTIVDFQHHDFYHLMRLSLTKRKDADLYISVGDALYAQKERYNQAIGKLKAICREKLNSYEDFKKRIDLLSPEQKEKALLKLEHEFCKVYKLISYLRRARKATGQFAFDFYDLDMRSANSFIDENARKGKNMDFLFHYNNMKFFLSRHKSEKAREHLGGMSAELAGRIVLPMISADLENPLEQYVDLQEKNKRSIEMAYGKAKLTTEESEAATYTEITQRCKRIKRFTEPLKDVKPADSSS